MSDYSHFRNFLKKDPGYLRCAPIVALLSTAFAADPLPLSSSYWKDPAFQKSFNGSYRIEARIEPSVSTEERGLLVLIQKFMAEGKRTVALETLKASSLTAKSPALLFNLGNLYFESGNNQEAIANYEAALKTYPSFRRAHRNLALAMIREDDLKKALEHLTEAVRLGDSDGTTYGMIGYCRLSQKEYSSALQAYRLAQVTEPDVPEWKAGVAQCLQNIGNHEEAIRLLGEIIYQRPLEASYAVLQANLYSGIGQNEAAMKALELPFRLGLLSPDETLQLASLSLRSGLNDEAEIHIEAAFSGEKKPSLDRILVVVEAASGNSDWAIVKKLLEMAETEKPPRALSLAKARYLIDSGENPADGEDLLKSLLSEDPTDGATLLALASVYITNGQANSAELLLERASKDLSTSYQAYIELARLHASQQRYEATLEAVDLALEIQKSDQLLRYREAVLNTLSASQ